MTNLLNSPHLAPSNPSEPRADPAFIDEIAPHTQGRLWKPKRVLVTKSAREWPLTERIIERSTAAGAEIVNLSHDRISGLKGETAAATYRNAKSTLAVIVASPSKRRPQPIPPSADFRFDLATGCPAHCQYCYLAGSLKGPPVTRVHANLPEVLAELAPCLGQGTITSKSRHRAGEGTTFEASCYTDPLGIEPMTGLLSDTIAWFGKWDADVQLRFTTKYDGIEPLLDIDHRGRTRARFSVNAEPITRRFEGGTAKLADRLSAMGRLAEAGYPVGLTIAPIMPIEDWEHHYTELLDQAAQALSRINRPNVTIELITHRFTPGSKAVLTEWYPASALEMDEQVRVQKRTKFGSVKFVYPRDLMADMKAFFNRQVPQALPDGHLLYWT